MLGAISDKTQVLTISYSGDIINIATYNKTVTFVMTADVLTRKGAHLDATTSSLFLLLKFIYVSTSDKPCIKIISLSQ